MTNWGPPTYREPTSSGYGEEQTLFAENGVYVTTARFVVGTVVFPIRGLTAVIPFCERPKRGVAFTCFGIAAFLFFAALGHPTAPISGGAFTIGLCLAGVGTFAWVSLKPRYGLRILTASTSVPAILTPDHSFVERVHVALNQALARR